MMRPLRNLLSTYPSPIPRVMHHSIQDITALSAAQKVTMVKTLADGWIAEEDVAGIERICSAVKTRGHADAIRKAVDPLSFTDIGQRTRLRVAFANMP